MDASIIVFGTSGVRGKNLQKTLMCDGLLSSVPSDCVHRIVPRADAADSGRYIPTVPDGVKPIVFFIGCTYDYNRVSTMMAYADCGHEVHIIPEVNSTPEGESDLDFDHFNMLFGEKCVVHLSSLVRPS